jgi:hypothetical protein
MKPIKKTLAGAKYPASFAALYASNDPGVSALGKPWTRLDCGRLATQFQLTELTCRPDGRKQLLTPGSAGNETPASFAARYDPRDPGVSVPADHVVKSCFLPSGPTVELVELNSRPGDQKRLLLIILSISMIVLVFNLSSLSNVV